ncbi:MAG TPA: outer membrane beta-barrel protein [Sphingobacterium sp.]|nr:outer membrane beta-barrel protein [Sphingobacterium sp.]
MKGLYLLFAFTLFTHQARAQSIIKGEVLDEESNIKLSNATIMLIQARDSILVDFTRAAENGKFQLNKPVDGSFLLVISYPKYADFSVAVKGGQEPTEIGNIALKSMAHMIEEVVVTRRIPILIKGDTTEYDADSFTVDKNAKVEDLLKVLPGITVDASGKITAQGKTVEKVLVDGEEFFGDDPVLVTRNIRSDMVDKVQVYEKKSDQTERTGVDDGIRTQTINLTLKEDAKRGLFGKVEAGAGTDDFYIGQGFLNYFDKSLKVSAYVIGSNNGKTDLSREEAGILGGDGYGDGAYRGEGLPRSFNTGALYTDKSKDKKHTWRIDYKFNETETETERSSYTRNSFRDTILVTDYRGDANSYHNRHNFSLKHESKFDSLTTLTVWAGANKHKTNNSSKTLSSTVNQFGDPINENDGDLLNESLSESFNVNTLFTRKFRKERRSLSLGYNINGSRRDSDQYLYSKTGYFVRGVFERDSIVDQYKDNNSSYRHNSASITYSEPLTKGFVLSLEYKLANDFNHNVLESFNKNELNGRYDDFDEMYSNDFEYDTWKQTYNLALNYKMNDNISFNMSNFVENSELSQTNKYDGQHMSRAFLVYNPNMNAHIKLAGSKSLNINYRGNNTLPSLDQIQPLRSNTDPLNEYIGNENLRNSYTHDLSANMWSSNILKGSYYGFGASGSSTRDALIQNVFTDTVGKNTYIWENMSDHNNLNANLYTWYYTPLLKKYQIFHGLNGGINYASNYNYINQTLAKAETQSYRLGYGWRKSTTKGFDFDFELAPSYTIQQNSVGIGAGSRGFVFIGSGNFKYFLPAKFSLEANMSYLYQAPTEVYSEKFERFIINPALTRKFLRNETLILTLMVNDLLNQNVGFSRNQSGTQLTERRYNTIGRYCMLKLTWEINKMFTIGN